MFHVVCGNCDIKDLDNYRAGRDIHFIGPFDTEANAQDWVDMECGYVYWEIRETSEYAERHLTYEAP